MKSPLKVVCGMGFILVVMLAGISVCVQTDMETVCVEDGEPGLCERPSTAKMISVRTRRYDSSPSCFPCSHLLRILGQARELEAANKLKEAVKLLKDTINPDPTQMVLNRREASMLHHALAVMNLKAGDFRRAHTETVSCINRDPAASGMFQSWSDSTCCYLITKRALYDNAITDCYYLQGYIHAVRGGDSANKKAQHAILTPRPTGEAALATEDFVEAWKKGLNWWLSYDIPKQCEGHRALFFDWMNSPGGRVGVVQCCSLPRIPSQSVFYAPHKIKEIVYQDSPKLYGTPPTEACVPEKEGELCYIRTFESVAHFLLLMVMTLHYSLDKLTRFEERQTYMLRLKQHHLWGES